MRMEDAVSVCAPRAVTLLARQARRAGRTGEEACVPLPIMKRTRRLFLACFLPVISVYAQTRAPGPEFQITKIAPNFISSPQFTYTGAEQYQTDQRDRWLEVEVTFSATPEFTDELSLKYFILFNGKLLAGEVTHVNIPAARENRSVMYVTPKTLQRLLLGRPVTNNTLQNVAVQLMQQGALKHELNLNRAPAQWYATLPQVDGLVLNKNETPFAPLYWDRYCQIKSAR